MRKIIITIIFSIFLISCHKEDGLYIKIKNNTEIDVKGEIYLSEDNKTYKIADEWLFTVNGNGEKTIFIKPTNSRYFGVQVYGCSGKTLTLLQEKILEYKYGYQEEQFEISEDCKELNNKDCTEEILTDYRPECSSDSDAGIDIENDSELDINDDLFNDIYQDIQNDLEQDNDLVQDTGTDTGNDASVDIEFDNSGCIDNDGDSFGTGCANGNDCDDNNRMIWQTCGNCNFIRIDGSIGFNESRQGRGVTFNDYDNDYYLDIIVANYGSVNSFVYHNEQGASFNSVDFTYSFNGSGVALADVTNDGNMEIYFSTNNEEADYLLRFNGTDFENITEYSEIASYVNSYGFAMADYDNDGRIDIFVAVMESTSPVYNLLYHNTGAGVFAEVHESAGLTEEPHSTGAAWADYDNDSDPDLFVANNPGQNFLYKNNNNGTFTNVAQSSGITDLGNGMGVAWADYDNDGDLDLFVANDNSDYSQHNYLYKNDGDTFTKINDGVIDVATRSRNVAWADYDNDGDLDLFVANDEGRQDFLFENKEGVFVRIETVVGLDNASSSYGSAWGDYDNDGNLDLYISNFSQDLFYKNNCPQRNYIVVRPVVKNSNNTYRDAIGARVYIDYEGDEDFSFPGTLMQEVSGGSGLGSQNQMWLHFGLGDISNNVTVKIIFPGVGTVEQRTVIYRNVTINSRTVFKQDGTFENF